MSKQNIKEWISRNSGPFEKMALDIWARPELPFNEEYASAAQAKLLEDNGFRLTRKEGLPTAFMAEWGEGGPVAGILGEYDALAGLSQAAGIAERQIPVEGGPGHGCGHNLLGVGGVLAACAAKEALKAAGLKGVVRYYGCPGEEQLTGKGRMAALGYFDGADYSLAWHPGDFSYATACTMTAVVSAKFKFKGISAHAAASPETGRSALDAVELMNVGANYLREHMLDQDRLHYAITNGGLAPNIVHPEAEVWYYARSPHDAELALLWARLVKVARGAAMMTETEMSYEIIGGCYNTLPNQALNQVLEDNLINFAGPIVYDAAEREFAGRIQATLPPAQVANALTKPFSFDEEQKLLASRPLTTFDEGRFIMGSSDVGDVANIMPTSMIWNATWPVGVAHHSWQATSCAGSSLGLKGMLQGAATLAGTIFDIAADPSLAEKAKNEFAAKRQGRVYKPVETLLGKE